MKRRLAVLLLLSLLITGCWDRTELEDRAYVMLLGIDTGETSSLAVTAMLALTPSLTPSIMGGIVQPGRRMASALMTVEAETVTQAMQILNGMTSRRVDLRQVRAALFGEALARQGIAEVVSELIRSPDARETMLVSLAQGRAETVLRTIKPVSEINPARMVEGIGMQAKYLHLAPPVRLHQFATRMSVGGIDPVLPVLAVNTNPLGDGGEAPAPSAGPGELKRVSENPIDFVGTAIFRGDELTGTLTIDETQMLLALRGEMGKAYFSVFDPVQTSRQASLRLHQENLPQYRTAMIGNRPAVTVRILFEGEVLASPTGIDYSQEADRKRLERSIATYTERTIQQLVGKLTVWEADPVGFGLKFRRQFSTTPAWDAFSWPDRVSTMAVKVTVDARVRRYGLILAPIRAHPTER
ncbi:MAG TPA: Ger(x)C family spore germination protein [Symbiobacteriaceae bacterium]|nr:Ger(x)C family spore germination protein [Symbiobacteriaceae bacterium]